MLSIAQLIPPTFAFGFSRMDSAASNKALPYRGDCRWFEDHPKRKAYLRIEYINEFDFGIAPEHKRDPPRLHVLVVQLAPGMHFLFPPYRTSEPFWSEPKSRLDRDLQARFPGVEGFSPRNLKYMRSLAEAWPDPEIVPQRVALSPWGHLRLLLDQVKAPTARDWYLRAAVQEV